MKKIWLVAMALGLLFPLVACTQSVTGEVVRSDKARITAPPIDPADLAAAVDGNSAFAWSLYQNLRTKEGNLFYSPHSISLALAMTYAGARGETEKQMAAALRFSLEQARLHSALNALDLELAKRGQGAEGKDEKGFRLHIVNAIWGQSGYPFLAPFLDTLAQNYGAGLRTLDFIRQPEPSRRTINDWVSEETEDRIKDLIPEGVITPLTRLVLTNAIYFNAAWQYPFPEKATGPGQFHLLNGGTTEVSLMKQTEGFAYTEGDGYQAVELPYDKQELSMVILLPRPGEFGEFEEGLDAAKVAELIQDLEGKEVVLALPKFEFDSSFSLKDALTDLGMPVAFSPDGADFTGMTEKQELYISDVVHKAFVSVDEAGTEAAAATAVIVGTTSMPAEPVEFTADRPFIFLIRDIPTGAILFIGRVTNPA